MAQFLPDPPTAEELRALMLLAQTSPYRRIAIDCVVRNISGTGAALEVVTPLFIPEQFTLFVPTDQLKRRCHVVWRREKRIGVAFDLLENLPSIPT